MLAGSCRGPFVLQQPNRGLGKFPYLLRLPPTNLEYSDSFLGFSMPSTDKGHFLNQQLGSQPGIKEKGFVEEAALREFPNWLLTFMWGGVGHVDTCGHPPPHAYEDWPPNTSCSNALVWGTVHSALWRRREMHGCAVGWPLSWALQVATDAWLEAEATIGRLEEGLGSGEDMRLLLLC